MPTPQLPYDVLREIFEGLDKRTLRRCSLVCRSWTLPADHAGDLCSKLTVPISRSEQDFLDFLECIQRSERILMSIRELTLSGEPKNDNMWMQECSFSTLQQVIASLSLLQDMRIAGITFYNPTRMADWSPISLRKLELSYYDIAPNVSLTAILQLFEMIEQLHIENFWQLGIAEPNLYSSHPTRHLTQVQNLTIPDFDRLRDDLEQQSTAFTTLIESLCSVLDFRTVVGIRLESVLPRYAELYSRLLTRCPILLNLVVDRVAGSLSDVENFTLDLSVCAILRAIHLKNLCIAVEDYPTLLRRGQNRFTWQFMCSILSSVPVDNRVKRLQLDIKLKPGSRVGPFNLTSIHWSLQELNWAQFNQELSGLDSLKIVWVKVTEYSRGGEAFVHLMHHTLSKKLRERVYVERHLSFLQWGSAFDRIENLRHSAVESCHRVRSFPGVSVLRADREARFQVVKLG